MAEETVNMKQLIVYCRRGDTVVVRDIRDLSDTAGGFVNILAVFAAQGVNIVCDLQKIDTSTFEWIALMKVLRIYGEEKTVIEKDKRWLADLDAYFDLVEKKEITVAEVCKRMNIGKTTYYRRLHQVKTIPVKERYPELFDEYEAKVLKGEISVREACRQMNIGVTTYYRMRKDQIDQIDI